MDLELLPVTPESGREVITLADADTETRLDAEIVFVL